MLRVSLFLTILLLVGAAGRSFAAGEPLRFGLVGLVHDHAHGFVANLAERKDVELAGIVEANPVLIARYRERYHLPATLFYPTLEAMLDATGVPAVAVCSSTYDHLRLVKACAARSVHVMVEKPLATTLAQAREIAAAARGASIHVLVNYETTWYPSIQALPEAARAIGELRKFVVHDGHEGPREIGCSEEFLAWLTDPELNGGGALTDFGCYGANLITWLMHGQRPSSVVAVTQTIKPKVYPRVDDEATIVLTYPQAQGIIQASWNWPTGRKDLEVYGTRGAIVQPDRDTLRLRLAGGEAQTRTLPAVGGTQGDPLAFFGAVVRGELQPEGPSSLETNLIVMEILEAARESARTGRRVDLPLRP